MCTNYQQCKDKAATRGRKLANNTYLVVRDDGGYGIRLHNTEVVIHYADRVVLDSGGWQTVTTKERMNRFSDIRVWSDRGVWYAGGHPFADGITFYGDGTIAGQGEDPKATQKLRRQVQKYSKDYAKAFVAGEVPAPGAGDCWGCLMVADDGSRPLGGENHVLEHIQEKYYVPSMLNQAASLGTMSPMAGDYVARMWAGEPRDMFGDHEQECIRKAIRKFCFRKLGLAA